MQWFYFQGGVYKTIHLHLKKSSHLGNQQLGWFTYYSSSYLLAQLGSLFCFSLKMYVCVLSKLLFPWVKTKAESDSTHHADVTKTRCCWLMHCMAKKSGFNQVCLNPVLTCINVYVNFLGSPFFFYTKCLKDFGNRRLCSLCYRRGNRRIYIWEPEKRSSLGLFFGGVSCSPAPSVNVIFPLWMQNTVWSGSCSSVSEASVCIMTLHFISNPLNSTLTHFYVL